MGLRNLKDTKITQNLKRVIQKLPAEQQAEMVHRIKAYISLYGTQIEQNLPNYVGIAHYLYQTLDKLEAEIPAEARIRISCKKGCSFCCKIKVDVSEAEAWYILQYCQEKGIKIDWERFYKQISPKYQDVENWPLLSNNACAFLQPNGECGIYEARPLACRKYFVISDPKICDTSIGKNQPLVYVNMDMELLMTVIANTVLKFGSLAQMMIYVYKRQNRGNNP